MISNDESLITNKIQLSIEIASEILEVKMFEIAIVNQIFYLFVFRIYIKIN